jgi:hypothetical protein
MPPPGTQQGNWVWDGSNWVCDPDCGNGGSGSVPAPCPPFGPPVFSGPAGQPPWYPGANGGVSFGATFPPNPVRGHLFWDGSTFWLFDGAGWVVISGTGGGTNGGTTPGPSVSTTTKVFQLTTVPTVAIGASDVWSIIPFTSTPQVDTASGWDPVSHKYTPKKSGYFNFFVNGMCFGPGQNVVAFALLFNDNGSWQLNSQNYVCMGDTYNFTGAPAQAAFLTSSGIVHMNGTTDFVRLWAFTSDGNWNQISTTMPTMVGFILP